MTGPSNQENRTNKKAEDNNEYYKIIVYIIIGIIVYTYIYGVSITADSKGILTRFGKIQSVHDPGLVYTSPIHSIKQVVTKLNTDAKFNIQCKSYDDYYVTTDAYVDNYINCQDDECLKKIYTEYYITESDKYIPEDGMFFKYFPEVLPGICKKLTLYQMQTEKWTELFPLIREQIQKKVGDNITITSIRMTRPVARKEDLEWVQSNIGLVTNKIYRVMKYLYVSTEMY